jgi:intraflagellar transport protein 122
MAWTADGMTLGLGLYDGSVSLRDKAGAEKQRFAAGSSPVWSLLWSPGVSLGWQLRWLAGSERS